MVQRVWIHGSGRSGTSWVQKIFDHHPMVFSIFEPEARVKQKPSPQMEAPNPTPAESTRFANSLFTSREHRAMRRRPILPKAYRSAFQHQVRLGMIYGASALTKGAARAGLKSFNVNIPDLLHRSPTHEVVKTVSMDYPVGQMARSNSDIRFVFVIRHPCGNILSNMRGRTLGKMSERVYLPNRELLGRFYSFEAGVRAINESDFTELELFSYSWGVYNGLGQLAAKELPNIRVLRYEDLCADPIGVSKEFFDWVGLEWHENVEAFLASSLAQNGDAEGYHSFNRNPLVAANKWRQQISDDDWATISRITSKSPAAELFPDIGGGITPTASAI